MNTLTQEKLITTKEIAEQLNCSPKTVRENAKKCLPNKIFENGKQTFWTEKEVTLLVDFMQKNNNRKDLTCTTVVQAMTTKEIAKQLSTSPKVVLENAKKCLPNKIFENGKTTYWTEKEVTILLEYVKMNSHRTDTTFTNVSKGMETELTNALRIEMAYQKIDLIHKEIEKILQDENEKLKQENQKLSQEKETLQIELDESKEWYTIKRMQKLNPETEFKYTLLKAESKKLGYDVKKVFDQNYGEVNAYHKDIFENLYFDTLIYE